MPRREKMVQKIAKHYFCMGSYAEMPIIWAYAKKIWPSGVSPKRASKMQLLRDVVLRSIGHSIQKLWPKTIFLKKMPLLYFAFS